MAGAYKMYIDAAFRARLSWHETPPAKRAGFFLKAAELLEKKRKDLSQILIRKSGSVFRKAMFEIGATALCGTKHEGLFYHPTVLTGVDERMEIFQEETFGPIAPVMAVSDVDEAIRVANNTPYGLSAGIITGDFNQGLEIAERIESGMVHINDSFIHDEPHLPFGGVKDSGLGRFGGKASIEELTELRLVTVQRKPRHFPF